MDQPILDKKKRCPKGQFRNKAGVCVPKALPKAVPKALPKAVPKALPKAVPKALPKAVPKALPKATVKKTSKTNKTRKQTQTTIFAQRKKCIQNFRSKLTSTTA